VQHVWINHDHDLVDVQIQTLQTRAASTASAATGAASAQGPRRPQAVKQVVQAALVGLAAALALLVGGHQAALAAPAQASATSTATHAETIHTTANHPWLTADRGWVQAGDLRVGEPVVRLDGRTATVAALAVRPGVADYYNLTVSKLHTYAVGIGEYEVLMVAAW
jgi:hypothetical protein